MIPVLAVSPQDIDLAERWLRWHCALTQTGTRPSIAIFCAHSVDERQREALLTAAGNRDSLERAPAVHEEGYGCAANWLFKGALEMAETYHPEEPMLWIEADTVPIRPTWLAEITAEYAACGKPFMGDFHPFGTIPHMTGVAVYPPNWRELAPSLAALPGPKPECGWDTACAHETVPQMAQSRTIQQIWRPGPFTAANVSRVNASTALFHQCKDGSLIDVLAAQRGISIGPLRKDLFSREHPKRIRKWHPCRSGASGR